LKTATYIFHKKWNSFPIKIKSVVLLKPVSVSLRTRCDVGVTNTGDHLKKFFFFKALFLTFNPGGP